MKPILFNGEMVRAILKRRKTQTRRVIKLAYFGESATPGYAWRWRDKNMRWNEVTAARLLERYCPYGQVGDKLWVRETFALMIPAGASIHAERIPHYRADADTAPRWTPSIHMPRWASRITLEITGVKVERVQDISPQDIEREGLTPPSDSLNWVGTFQNNFRLLWDSINAKRGYGWDANPWVWVLTFEVA